MHQAFLSEVELYFSDELYLSENRIVLSEDEAHHAGHVMRHDEGNFIFVTDGKGTIYKTEITELNKNTIELLVVSETKYHNDFANITFCIPRMKNKERFEFAIEKCVELGITNFIVFESDRTISKGDKTDKWIKLGMGAMKQSLRAFLPEFHFEESIDALIKKSANNESTLFLLDQKADEKFSTHVDDILNSEKDSYFIFGPEGGISERELYLLKDAKFLRLTENRLRSETAIISAGILLTQ